MNRDVRFKNFVDKANAKYDGKFDYSQVNYTEQKCLVKIICPIHGEFFQTPDKHLSSKFGCQKCSSSFKIRPKTRKSKKSKYTKEYTLDVLNEKFKNKFILHMDIFNETLDGVIIIECPIHGKFENNVRNLVSKKNSTGCSKCHHEALRKNMTKSYDHFVCQANKIHNLKYKYPEDNNQTYKNKKSIVKIICPIHGEFTKKAQKHILGQGCIQCMYDKLIASGVLPGGYCEQTFMENPSLKLVDAKLYYVSINNGKFFKIGITIKQVKDRMRHLKSDSKGYIKNSEIIYEFKASLYKCYLAEQKILETYSYARSPRNWSTEIFNEDISKNDNFLKICEVCK